MGFIFKYFKKYKVQCIIGPLFKVFEVVFEMLVPYIIANIINIGIANKDTEYIKRSVMLLIIFAIVGFSCTLLAQYMSAFAAINISSDIREDAFAKVLKLKIKDIDKLGTSKILTTLTSDINQIQTGVNLALRLLLRSPFVILGCIIMAFLYDPKTAVLFIGVVTVLGVIVGLNFKKSVPAYKLVRNELDNVVTETDDGLNGVRVIRGFIQTENEAKNFKEHTKLLNILQMGSAKITTVLNPLTFLIVNLFVCLLIYTGALEIKSSVLTVGAVVALFNYMNQILVELLKFSNLIIQISRALACANRVNAVISMESDLEIVLFPETKEGTILSLNKVAFSYNDDDSYALNNIDLDIRRGESVGIIGKTGCGKSTLGAIIAGTYKPTSGEISYDNGVIPKVGYCMQKTRLFSGTVDYNIKLDRPDISDEDVSYALDVSCCRDFVTDVNKVLTESGKNLSGGQRQRINIARALANRPEILVLDDASASLDAITEKHFIDNLNSLEDEMTKVIISQKIKSVKNCDKIIVLDEGEIVNVGRHDDLLKESSVYKEMCDLQMKEAVS